MARTLSIEPIHIEIVVEGHFDPHRVVWPEGITLISLTRNQTSITGFVADETALFALISRVRDLGLRLISVNRNP